MAWIGYYEFDGNEIVNVERTEAYASHLPWFKPVYRHEDLAPMLGDGDRYTTPLIDDAPWVDPLYPESVDFYGFYPLNVTGLEDSTRSSTPVESLDAGGTPGRIRHTTRQMVFQGILIGATEAATEYGMRWLREALSGGACGDDVTSTGLGGTLCFFSSEPEIDVIKEGTTAVLAVLDGGYYLHDGTFTDGLADGGDATTEVTADEDTYEGGDAEASGEDEVYGGSAEVTGSSSMPGLFAIQSDDLILSGGGPSSLADLVLSGGDSSTVVPVIQESAFPFDFDPGDARDVYPADCLEPYRRSLRRVLVNSGPTISNKSKIRDGGQVWTVDFTAVAGVPFDIGPEIPVIEGFLNPEVDVPWAGGVVPEGGSIDLDGFIYPESSCLKIPSQPLYDPLAPIVAPPAPPNVPLGNYVPPQNWRRRQFTVPKSYVPSWGEVVPKLQIHATTDLRALRIRFYSDPYEIGDISDDPCAYCGDLVVTYLPANHTLVLDGAEQRAYVLAPGGQQRRADSLVIAADGTPFEWPVLSCGFGYVVTLDLPQTQATPVVDLSLFARAAA